MTNISNETASSSPEFLSFDVFPNLITDSVAATIRIQNSRPSELQQAELSVFNILGQVLHQEPISIPQGLSDISLETQSLQLAPGVYYVVLYAEGKRLSRQLIVR